MPVRTRCPRCETVLNVPIGAEGRKLKCPRCTTTFRVGDPGATARSSMPGVDTASPVSSPSMTDLPGRPRPRDDRPAPPGRPRDEDDDLPVIAGDLRDQFDLPLLREEDDRPAPGPSSSPPPRPRPAPPPPPPSSPSEAGGPSSGAIPAVPVGPSPYAEADAARLIEDDEPVRPRRRGGAESRSASRRCSCGGVVPAGMSLCPRCGLDLETGARDATFDVIEVDAPVLPRAAPPPFGVLVVGVTAAIVGVGLSIAALVLYVLRDDLPMRWGFLLLAAVSAFGVYGAVRMLRGRSARMLMTALLLGGLIDVVALIVLPISVASTVPLAEPDADGEPGLVDLHGVPRIIPLTERIDWAKVNLGLAILALTTVVAIYLNTAEVRRYGDRRP